MPEAAEPQSLAMPASPRNASLAASLSLSETSAWESDGPNGLHEHAHAQPNGLADADGKAEKEGPDREGDLEMAGLDDHGHHRERSPAQHSPGRRSGASPQRLDELDREDGELDGDRDRDREREAADREREERVENGDEDDTGYGFATDLGEERKMSHSSSVFDSLGASASSTSTAAFVSDPMEPPAKRRHIDPAASPTDGNALKAANAHANGNGINHSDGHGPSGSSTNAMQLDRSDSDPEQPTIKGSGQPAPNGIHSEQPPILATGP